MFRRVDNTIHVIISLHEPVEYLDPKSGCDYRIERAMSEAHRLVAVVAPEWTVNRTGIHIIPRQFITTLYFIRGQLGLKIASYNYLAQRSGVHVEGVMADAGYPVVDRNGFKLDGEFIAQLLGGDTMKS